jgi:tRNA-modifying protein YgfZ
VGDTTVQARWGRDVVAVSGDDAESFLQGQLSQDLSGMRPAESRWSWLLQPQGKVDALLRVAWTGTGFLLDTDAGWGDAVVARLRRFLLRVKVTVEPLEWQCIAVRDRTSPDLAVDVPSGTLVALAEWPGFNGVDILGPAVEPRADTPLVDADAFEAMRIEAGFPAMGRELGPDTIPAEAGAWLIERTVNFTKGCFTGQELVARIDSRGGNVPRPIRGLVGEGDRVPAPGDEVLVGDKVVGHVTSAAWSETLAAPVALAVVARTVELDTTVVLRGPGGEGVARLAPLPLIS